MKRTTPLRRLFAKSRPATVGWIVTMSPVDDASTAKRYVVAVAAQHDARNKALSVDANATARIARLRIRLEEASALELASMKRGEIKELGPTA